MVEKRRVTRGELSTFWEESRSYLQVKNRNQREDRDSDHEVDLRRWIRDSSNVIPMEDCILSQLGESSKSLSWQFPHHILQDQPR